MKKNLFLSLALATVCMGAVQAQTVLFESPFTSDYNTQMPYRIPAIVKTGNDELLVFSDKRHGGGDVGQYQSNSSAKNAHVDLVYKRSTDNGATWSNEQTIIKGNQNMGYGDVAVVADRENPNNIVFFCAAGNVFFTNSTSSNPLRCFRFRSSDGGVTWSNEEVTSDIYDLFSYTAAFFSSGRICQSSQIKVGNYYRLYAALCVNGTNSIVIYSDDFGGTWNVLGGSNTVAVSGGNEAKCEELPNGSVLVSSRVANGRYFNVFNYTDEATGKGNWNGRGTGLSGKDGGATNGEVLLVPAKDSKGNQCKILLQSLPIASGRSKVGICWRKLSSDNITQTSEFTGADWTVYDISKQTSAYSTMVLQADGNIGFVWEELLQDYGTGGYDITYMSLNLNTITGGQYSYDAGTVEEVKTVETPAITPNGGEFTGSATFEITCTTDDAAIYYTTDGADPATKGKAYTGKVTLTESATVKAIAMKEGWNNSELVEATFTIIPESTGGETVKVTKYRFKNVQYNNGTKRYFAYDANNGLTLTTDVNSAHLYTRTTVDQANGVYKFQSEDGNYLVWKGSGEGYNNNKGYVTEYNSTWCDLTVKTLTQSDCVSGTGTVPSGYVFIKGKRNDGSTDGVFIVSSSGNFDKTTTPYYSSSYSSAFVIEEVEVEVEGGEVIETVATPVISPNGGEVESGTAISISCTTDGAAIYYTLDGTTPSASNSTKYTAPFALTANATVSAIAILDGFNDSEVATATFTIKEEEVVETVEWITSIINCDKESCSASSYSTLYLDYAVELPSGVKAYRGVLNAEEGTLTLYQIKTGVVPALCAVIIENTHVGSSITLTKTTTTATYANDLKGTLVAIAGIDPSNYYVLGHTQAYHLGFYHPNSTTLAANKAYIEWSSSNARSLTIKRGDDEETTAISEMESIENAVIYNLLGQRVYHMESGKIYIVNGKKVVIK